MSVAYSFAICSTVSGFFPVLAALYNYRNLDKVLKIAAVYFVISVAADVLQEIMKRNGSINNMPVIHAYILISILFFGAMYYNAFFSPLVKKTIIILTCISFLVSVINIFSYEGLQEYPSVSNTVLSIMLICFSLAYFYQLLTRQEFVHIEKQGLFWINAGILFYFSITIFLFMLYKQMLIEHQEGFYMINYITNIIANILYTTGLLCKPQKAT